MCIALVASCDASELLPNAANVGSCSAALPSGESCTNMPISDYTCFPASCLDGDLTLGVCIGKFAMIVGWSCTFPGPSSLFNLHFEFTEM